MVTRRETRPACLERNGPMVAWGAGVRQRWAGRGNRRHGGKHRLREEQDGRASALAELVGEAAPDSIPQPVMGLPPRCRIGRMPAGPRAPKPLGHSLSPTRKCPAGVLHSGHCLWVIDNEIDHANTTRDTLFRQDLFLFNGRLAPHMGYHHHSSARQAFELVSPVGTRDGALVQQTRLE